MLGIILAIAAFTDFKYRKIPNGIDFLLGIYAVFFSGASVYDRIAGFLLTAGTVCALLFAGGKIKGLRSREVAREAAERLRVGRNRVYSLLMAEKE